MATGERRGRLPIEKDIGRRASEAHSLRGDLKRFTRSRILEAALQAFTENGYRATSVDRIVELAGTTAPTFYRHFPSKSDLLPYLSHHLADEVAETLRALDALGPSPSRAYVRSWLEIFSAMWGRMRWLCDAFWEAVRVDEDFASANFSESLRTVEVMERLLAGRSAAKRRKLKIRLALLIPMMDRVMEVHHLEKDERVKKQLLDEFAEMIRLGIFLDPALAR